MKVIFKVSEDKSTQDIYRRLSAFSRTNLDLGILSDLINFEQKKLSVFPNRLKIKTWVNKVYPTLKEKANEILDVADGISNLPSNLKEITSILRKFVESNTFESDLFYLLRFLNARMNDSDSKKNTFARLHDFESILATISLLAEEITKACRKLHEGDASSKEKIEQSTQALTIYNQRVMDEFEYRSESTRDYIKNTLNLIASKLKSFENNLPSNVEESYEEIKDSIKSLGNAYRLLG